MHEKFPIVCTLDIRHNLTLRNSNIKIILQALHTMHCMFCELRSLNSLPPQNNSIKRSQQIGKFLIRILINARTHTHTHKVEETNQKVISIANEETASRESK